MSSEEWGLCRTCGVWIEGEWYSTDDIRRAVEADDVKLVLKAWKHGQPPVRWIPVAPIHGACGRPMRPNDARTRWACNPCAFSVSMNADEIRAFERKTVLRPVPAEDSDRCSHCGRAEDAICHLFFCHTCGEQFCELCGQWRPVPYPDGKNKPVFASEGTKWQCHGCWGLGETEIRRILDQLVAHINLLPQSQAVTDLISTDLSHLNDALLENQK